MRSHRHIVCLLLGLSSVAALACEHPTVPNVPSDERIRGRAERALKDEVRSYITDMSIYAACVQAEYRAADNDAVLEIIRSLLATRNNTAIAELEAFRDIYVASVGPLEELFFDESGGAPGRPPATWPAMRTLRCASSKRAVSRNRSTSSLRRCCRSRCQTSCRTRSRRQRRLIRQATSTSAST